MVGDLSPFGANFPAYHIAIKSGVLGAMVKLILPHVRALSDVNTRAKSSRAY